MKNRNLFPTVLKVGKSKIKAPADTVLVSARSLLSRWSLVSVSSLGRRNELAPLGLYIKSLILSIKVELVWPNHLLKAPPLYFLFLVEMEYHCVAQAGVKFLGSSDPSAWASQKCCGYRCEPHLLILLYWGLSFKTNFGGTQTLKLQHQMIKSLRSLLPLDLPS